jgi:hypothetical protein
MTEVLVCIAVLAGVYLGHFLTMKAFSHVQPSTKDVMLQIKGGVQTEPDPWAEPKEEIEEPVLTSASSPEEILEEIKRKTGVKPEDMYGVTA